MLATNSVYAGPQGGEIVGGNGSIQQSNSDTLVNQASHSMAINWESFNLSSSESVTFQQPTASSVVLNRIQDGNASQIFGQINANGRVLLSNPHGIVFGPNAQVNVGGLLATGLQMNVNEFMNGRYRLFVEEGMNPGAIVNQGTLQAATGGSISLIGGAVENDGAILADYGRVNLATGNAAVIDFDSDGLMTFKIDEEVVNKIDGHEEGIKNTGSIEAEGGEVLISAQAAKDVFANVVNNSGIIKANKIDRSGGVIRLVGSGTVINTGDVDASSSDLSGGSIHILGEKVGLASDSIVNASGVTGGGEVLVGGSFQGKNPEIQNASHTFVGADVEIKADAIESGNGGEVIVWADEVTRYYGNISATGGESSGDGGFVEVSGKEKLDFNGDVNLTATQGGNGILLLDPRDINIGNTSTHNSQLDLDVPSGDPLGFIGFDDNLDDGDPSDDDFLIAASALSNISGDITLQATRDINVTSAIDFGNPVNNSATFSLSAGNDINISAGITSNGRNVNLSANDPASGSATGSGSISVSGAINTSAGNGGDVTFNLNNGSGTVTLNNTINAGNGAVQFITTSAGEIALNSAIITNNLSGDAGNVSLGSSSTLTIVDALKVTGDSSVLTLPAASFVEAVNIDGKDAFTLQGAGSTTILDPDSTVGPTGTGVTITNSTNVTVKDLAITDAVTAIDFNNAVPEADTLTVENVVLTGNTTGVNANNIDTLNFNATTGVIDDTVVVSASTISHTRDAIAQNIINYTNVTNLNIDGGDGTDSVDYSTIDAATVLNIDIISNAQGFESIIGNGNNFTLSGVTDFDASLNTANSSSVVSGFGAIAGDNTGTLSNVTNYTISSGSDGTVNYSGFTTVSGDNTGELIGLSVDYDDGNDIATAAQAGVLYSNFQKLTGAFDIINVDHGFNVSTGVSTTNNNDYSNSTYSTVTADLIDTSDNLLSNVTNFNANAGSTGGVTFNNFTTVNGSGNLNNITNYNASTGSDGAVTYSGFASITGDNTGTLSDVTNYTIATGSDGSTNYSGFSAVSGDNTGELIGLSVDYNDGNDVATADQAGVLYSNFQKLTGTFNIVNVDQGFNAATAVSTVNNNDYSSATYSTVSADLVDTSDNVLTQVTNFNINSRNDGSATFNNFTTVSGDNTGELTGLAVNYDDGNDATATAQAGVQYSDFQKLTGIFDIVNVEHGFNAATGISTVNNNDYSGATYTTVTADLIDTSDNALSGVTNFNANNGNDGSVTFNNFTTVQGDNTGELIGLTVNYDDGNDIAVAAQAGVLYSNFQKLTGTFDIINVDHGFNVSTGVSTTNNNDYSSSTYSTVTADLIDTSDNVLSNVTNFNANAGSTGSVTFNNFTTVNGSGNLNNITNYNASTGSDGAVTYSGFASITGDNTGTLSDVTNYTIATGSDGSTNYSGFSAVSGDNTGELIGLSVDYDDGNDVATADQAGVLYSNFQKLTGTFDIVNVEHGFNAATALSTVNNNDYSGATYTTVTADIIDTSDNALSGVTNFNANTGNDGSVTFNNFTTVSGDNTGELTGLAVNYDDGNDATAIAQAGVQYSDFQKLVGTFDIVNVDHGFNAATGISTINNNDYSGATYTTVTADLIDTSDNALSGVTNFNANTGSDGSVVFENFTAVTGDNTGALSNVVNYDVASGSDGAVNYSNFISIAGDNTGTLSNVTNFTISSGSDGAVTYSDFAAVSGDNTGELLGLTVNYDDGNDTAVTTQAGVQYSDFQKLTGTFDIVNADHGFNAATGISIVNNNDYSSAAYTAVSADLLDTSDNTLSGVTNFNASTGSDGSVTFTNFTTVNGDNTGALTGVTNYNIPAASDGLVAYSGFAAINGDNTGELIGLLVDYDDGNDTATTTQGGVLYGNFQKLDGTFDIVNVNHGFNATTSTSLINNNDYSAVTYSNVSADVLDTSDNTLSGITNFNVATLNDGSVTYNNFTSVIGDSTGSLSDVTNYDITTESDGVSTYSGFISISGNNTGELVGLSVNYDDGNDTATTTQAGVIYSDFQKLTGTFDIVNVDHGFNSATSISGVNNNDYSDATYVNVTADIVDTSDNVLSDVTNFNASTNSDGSVTFNNFTAITGDDTGILQISGLAYDDGNDSATDGTVVYGNFATINGVTDITNVTDTFDVATGISGNGNNYGAPGSGYSSVTGVGGAAQLNNLSLAYDDAADSALDAVNTITYSNFAIINEATAITNVTDTFDVATRLSGNSNSYGVGFDMVTGAGVNAQLDNLGAAYDDGNDIANANSVNYENFLFVNGATAITNVTGTFDVVSGVSGNGNSYGAGFTSVTGSGINAQLENLGGAYDDGNDTATVNSVSYNNFAIINNATAISNVTKTFDVTTLVSGNNNSYGAGFTIVTGSGGDAQLDDLNVAYDDGNDTATNGIVTYNNFAKINNATSITNVTKSFDVVSRVSGNGNTYGSGFNTVTGFGGDAQLDNLGASYDDAADIATVGLVSYSNFAQINGATKIFQANQGFNADTGTSKNSDPEKINQYGAGFTEVYGAGTLDNVTDFTIFGENDGIDGSIKYFDFTSVSSVGAGTISNGTAWLVDGTDQGTVDGIQFSGFENLTGSTASDLFEFTADGSVTGTVNGGAGTDTIDLTVKPNAIFAELSASGNVDGFSGVITNVVAGFNNIDSISASTVSVGDSLKGIDGVATWNIGTSNSYSSGNSLAFSGFENLEGGSSADSFNLSATDEQLSIVGSGGTDSLALTGNISATDGLNFSLETINNDSESTITSSRLTLVGVTSVASEDKPLKTELDELQVLSSNANIFITENNGLELLDINNGEGQLSLTLTNGSLTNNNNRNIVAGDIGLVVEGLNSAIGSNDQFINLMSSGSTSAIAANGNGSIYLDHNGDMEVASIDAGAGNIELNVSGSIVDALGSDDITDLNANGLFVVANGAIGRSENDALNVQIADFSLQNSSIEGVFLQNDSNSLEIASSEIAGNLTINTTGEIEQSGAVIVNGSSTFNAESIDLDNNNNDFNGSVSLNTFGFSDSAKLHNKDELNFATSTVGGSLLVKSGGDITQTGAIIVEGTSNFDSGLNSMTLDNSGNNFKGQISLSSDSINGDVSLATAGDLTTANSIVGGTLQLASGGDAEIGFTTVGENFTVNAGGAITQSGEFSVAGNSNFVTENGDVLLSNTQNEFIGTVSFNTTSSNPSAAKVIDSLAGDVDVVSTMALVFDNSKVSGNFSATANGSITQIGSMEVGGDSQFETGENSIALNNSANDFVGAVSASTQGENNHVSFTDTNALVTASLSSGGDLTINSSGVNLSGDTAVAGNLLINSGGLVNQESGLLVVGTTTLNTNNASIDLANNANLLSGEVSISATGSNTTVDVFNGRDITLAATNIGGDLNITSTANIIQSDVVTIAGDSSFNTGAGDIILDNVNNDFNGSFSANSASGKNVTVIDKDGLTINKITANSANVELTVVNGTIQSANSSSVVNIQGDVVSLKARQAGEFSSPININASETILATKVEANIVGNYGQLVILEGLFVDPLSNARIAASQQNTNLRDVVFIDAGLFSQSLSLFNAVGTGIRLPADQLEEELDEDEAL